MSKRKLEDEAILLAMDAKSNRNEKTILPPTHYGNIAQLLAEREIEGPKYRGKCFHMEETFDFIAIFQLLYKLIYVVARKVYQTFTSLDNSSKKIRLGSISEQISSNFMWVSRLKLKKELEKHEGCVNTVNWNSEGTRLITGSDDCKLVSEIFSSLNIAVYMGFSS